MTFFISHALCLTCLNPTPLVAILFGSKLMAFHICLSHPSFNKYLGYYRAKGSERTGTKHAFKVRWREIGEINFITYPTSFDLMFMVERIIRFTLYFTFITTD